MSGSNWVVRARVPVLAVMAAAATTLAGASAGMASASVVAHRPPIAARRGVGPGLSLVQAPAGLREAVRRALGLHASRAEGAVQQAEWTGGAADDYFGISVAISGSTAVVGSPGTNSDVGAAYVFVQSGGKWSEQIELTATGGVPGDFFGRSVAISGSTVVVGADGANSFTGSAYVFVRSGYNWSEKATLSGASAGDFFGDAVAVSGSTVVVGAGGGSSFPGAAYVYAPSGGTWTQQFEFTDPEQTVNDEFGSSVAMSGSTVVVGASGSASGTDLGAGAAYVYAGSGSSWVQQAALAGAAAGDAFGSGVAISGSTVVVGAYGNDSATGAAYVYAGSHGGWSKKTEFAGTVAGDYFGFSVATSGSTVMVGSDDATSGTGAVYLFASSGGSWSKLGELTPGGSGVDAFGISVAVEGSTAVVGADTTSTNAGAAYVFDTAVRSATSLKLSASKVTFGHEASEHLSVQVRASYPAVTGKVTITAKASKGKSVRVCVIKLKSGKGSCALSAGVLRAGTYALTAAYGGSINVLGSTSAKRTLTVRK